MKRVIFGVIWFIVFFVVLYIIFSIIVGVIVAHDVGAQGPVNYQEGLQAGRVYAQQHAAALGIWRLVILVVSIVLAVAGTIKGVLPGTKKPQAVVAAE